MTDCMFQRAVIQKKQVEADRLLRTRTILSIQSIGNGVRRRVTNVMFVESGVKINGAYYRDVLLS